MVAGHGQHIAVSAGEKSQESGAKQAGSSAFPMGEMQEPAQKLKWFLSHTLCEWVFFKHRSSSGTLVFLCKWDMYSQAMLACHLSLLLTHLVPLLPSHMRQQSLHALIFDTSLVHLYTLQKIFFPFQLLCSWHHFCLFFTLLFAHGLPSVVTLELWCAQLSSEWRALLLMLSASILLTCYIGT